MVDSSVVHQEGECVLSVSSNTVILTYFHTFICFVHEAYLASLKKRFDGRYP